MLLIIPWIWGGVGSSSEKAKGPGQHNLCVAEPPRAGPGAGAQDSVCCSQPCYGHMWLHTAWEGRVLFVWSLEIETKLPFQDNYLLLMSPRSQ